MSKKSEEFFGVFFPKTREESNTSLWEAPPLPPPRHLNPFLWVFLPAERIAFPPNPWKTTPSVLLHLLTRTWWGDKGLILKNTLPVMWGTLWQEELSHWQAPDSRFVDFMVTSFKVTTGWSMPSDNPFERWLWKALSISASHYYGICSSICAVLQDSLIIITYAQAQIIPPTPEYKNFF